MSNVQLQVKKLLNNIQQDHKRYSQLVTLLSNQRTFMIGRNTDLLEQLNQEVEALYQQLNASTTERSSTLKELNIPATTEGMQNFFGRLPATFAHKAQSLWQMLEQQIMACKQINDSNCRLLNSQQEILNALLGNQPDMIYQR